MYEWLPYPNNSLVQQIGGTSSKYFQNARSVLFHFTDNPAKDSLTKVFNQGYAGCVHFHVSWNCHMKRRAMKWLYYTVHSGRFEKIVIDNKVPHFPRQYPHLDKGPYFNNTLAHKGTVNLSKMLT